MAYPIQNIPDRTISINGKPHLYFGGTAYLGLQNYTPFKELYLNNVSKYGMHYGASRKSNVSLDIYDKSENFLTKWVGSESCLTMSSGYLAALLVVQIYLEKGHPVIAVPNAHAALVTHGVIKTKGFEELKELINTTVRENLLPPVVVFDTIDFSGEHYPNFKKLKELPLDKIILVGDDSHGIGVVGHQGNGCFNTLKALNPYKLLVCCSLGKALGIQAGAIFGNNGDIKTLESASFFGGASPASPSFMATLLDAQNIYSERMDKLKDNYAHFKSQVRNVSFFMQMEGHPTFEFQDEQLAHELIDNRFIFTNFHYPDDTGPLISRIVLSAYHTTEDIEALAQRVNALIG